MFSLEDVSEDASYVGGTTRSAWAVVLPYGRLGHATVEFAALNSGRRPSRDDVLARLILLSEADGLESVIARLTSERGLDVSDAG